MAYKVVLLDATTEERAEKLRQYIPDGFVLTHGTARGDAHMKEIIADADFAITGQVAVSGDVLRAAKKLKLLHKWGVGVDNIDLDTARACGIAVARTTGGNAIPVAEFTIGLMIATLRNIAYGHAELKKGEWRTGRMPRESMMLTGKTVGIIGYGAIGQALTRMLTAFQCNVIYNKRTPLSAEKEAELGVRYATIDELLSASDVISLNCPLTDETKNIINATALARMKPAAVLINVARGGVVNEMDLIAALQAKTISAAAMDVYETEPLPASSPLLNVENLVVTPHLAAMAADHVPKMLAHMFANMQRLIDGAQFPPGDRVV